MRAIPVAVFYTYIRIMNIGYVLNLFLLLAGISNSVQTATGFEVETTGLPADTPFLQISSGLADEPVDPYDTGAASKIAKDNYRRISAITRWTSIATRGLERSLEGGEAKFYFTGTRLEKIIVRDYGETYQQLTEYYLRNGQLTTCLFTLILRLPPAKQNSSIFKNRRL